MRFQEKLRKYSKKELWDEYCGFLTLKPEEFMRIQRRLLQEQMELWSSSALGQSILKGKYRLYFVSGVCQNDGLPGDVGE